MGSDSGAQAYDGKGHWRDYGFDATQYYCNCWNDFFKVFAGPKGPGFMCLECGAGHTVRSERGASEVHEGVHEEAAGGGEG